MKSDLDKHIERQTKDRDFKVYFEKVEDSRELSNTHSSGRKKAPQVFVRLMKKEYDFSKGERGKFYRPDTELYLSIYIEPTMMI